MQIDQHYVSLQTSLSGPRHVTTTTSQSNLAICKAKSRSLLALLSCSFILALCVTAHAQGSLPSDRWSDSKAQEWYAHQPWLVGSNYIPSDAINQLEMWQADTFNPQEIDRELGWAQAAGMNTMRVFLHDLLWQQDPAGFKKRINEFLAIADRHGIHPIFVIFDSVWDPSPKLGMQHPPIPGVHNSGWVQSPGMDALRNGSEYPRLEVYVKGVVGAFANDSRILAWDVWNEPDNDNASNYGLLKPETDKQQLVATLLPQVFSWARSAHPIQPLTSGVFHGDFDDLSKMSPVPRIQLTESDVISFHDYGWPEEFERHATQLRSYHRPILCTEYMARGAGSTFDAILPVALQYHVAAINWGLVNGKTQTNFPWDSWLHPYVLLKPTIWFHDVFYMDGTPYRKQELLQLQTLTSKANKR
jgi:hypothetical protein